MKRTMKKTFAMIFCSAICVTSVLGATPDVSADFSQDKYVSTCAYEVQADEPVEFEAVGLKNTYATGETITVQARAINNSGKDLKIETSTTSYGKGGTISARLTNEDGNVIEGFDSCDCIINREKYSGSLNADEYAERMFQFDIGKAVPGTYSLEISFEYIGENNAKQTVSKKFSLEIGAGGGVEYEWADITGAAAFLSDKAADIRSYKNELDACDLKLPVKLYPYPGAKNYVTVMAEDYGFDFSPTSNCVPVKVYTDENLKVWGYVKRVGFEKEPAWYCITDFMRAIPAVTWEKDTIIGISEDPATHIKTLRFKDFVLSVSDDITILKNDTKISADDLRVGMVVTYDVTSVLESYPAVIVGCTTIKVENERYLCVYKGDFDYDGSVTLKDAKKALCLALGIDELTEEQKVFCDIDGDGKAAVTLSDAKECLRMALGIIQAVKEGVSFDVPKCNEVKCVGDKIEAVREERNYYRYFPIVFEDELLDAKEYNRSSFVYRVDMEENKFATEFALMQLFDIYEEDVDQYEYFVGSYNYWCDKFGYDNLQVSLEDCNSGVAITVDNRTTYFYDEIGGEDVSSGFKSYNVVFKIPKSELAGKKVYKDYRYEYGVGYEKAENVNWTISKVPNVKEATQSACILTAESAELQGIADKFDFEKNDYIVLTIPFDVEDSYDSRYEVTVDTATCADDSRKTVSEMYHSGEIIKPNDFNPDTYLNDRVWICENPFIKWLTVKVNFTLYDQLYYEDIGNYGTVIIPVEKGRYSDYTVKYERFARDLTLSLIAC